MATCAAARLGGLRWWQPVALACAAVLLPVGAAVLALSFLLALAQAVPLALWRAVEARRLRGRAPRSLAVIFKRGCGDALDLPYLRCAIRHVPAALLGPSALLLMVCDPQVARAVNGHSTYLENPLRRLLETLVLVYALSAGDARAHAHARAHVHGKHAAIRGPGYSAESQPAQVWVWANLVASLEWQYRVACPEAALCDAGALEAFLDELYRDWRQWAINFGVLAVGVPADRAAFRLYYDGRCEALRRGGLSSDSRDALAGLSDIPSLWYLGPLWPLAALLRNAMLACLAPPWREHLAVGRNWSGRCALKVLLFSWGNEPYLLRHGLLCAQALVGDALVRLAQRRARLSGATTGKTE
jgi:uncharacterized protein (DUF2236 family)